MQGGINVKNSLLFVNQNKEIIQEFLDAMEGNDFEIDTTDSGLEAAVLLQKKQYKVVVTGINLATYDGTKIIAYLNEYCPQTLCIVYTVRLELAHLKLLVNERRVFRIFQRPVDYSGELFDAIMDAFTCYDAKEAKMQSDKILGDNLKNAAVNSKKMKKVVEERPQEKESLIKFIKSLLNVFEKNIASELPKDEMRQLVRYEKDLVLWMTDDKNKSMNSLEEVSNKIYQEFSGSGEREMEIKLRGCPPKVNVDLCVNVYFILHMLLKRFSMISPEYQARINIISLSRSRYCVRLDGIFPAGAWNAGHERKIDRTLTAVTQTILECLVDKCNQNINDEKVMYQVEMESLFLS